MGVTLDQILILAGPLDDAPGFDTPRERFRRFLTDHVRTLPVARTLIDQCQYAPGEQHRRALEDLVVLTGRFIGFEPILSSSPQGGFHGIWHSRSHLRVAVDVRSDHAHAADAGQLSQSIAAIAQAPGRTGTHVTALSVLTPLCMNRRRMEEQFAAAKAFPIAVTSLAGVLALAEIVQTGRMTHEDVVRMFETNVPVEFIAHLLERVPDVLRLPAAEAVGLSESPVADESRFWIATVVADHATGPEEFLRLVVAKRQVFGIADAEHGAKAGVGDWICFYIPGRGIVGHARVGSLTASGGGLRDAHRFHQIVRLEEVELHLSTPIPSDPESQLRLRAMPTGSRRTTSTLVGISRESFQAMTASRQMRLEATEPIGTPARN